jgi:hypothetical protein
MASPQFTSTPKKATLVITRILEIIKSECTDFERHLLLRPTGFQA